MQSLASCSSVREIKREEKCSSFGFAVVAQTPHSSTCHAFWGASERLHTALHSSTLYVGMRVEFIWPIDCMVFKGETGCTCPVPVLCHRHRWSDCVQRNAQGSCQLFGWTRRANRGQLPHPDTRHPRKRQNAPCASWYVLHSSRTRLAWCLCRTGTSGSRTVRLVGFSVVHY